MGDFLQQLQRCLWTIWTSCLFVEPVLELEWNLYKNLFTRGDICYFVRNPMWFLGTYTVKNLRKQIIISKKKKNFRNSIFYLDQEPSIQLCLQYFSLFCHWCQFVWLGYVDSTNNFPFCISRTYLLYKQYKKVLR